MKSMLILSVFILFASCVVCEDKADKAEDGDLEKCGKSLEKLYNKVCSEKDVGGKKLFAVRKICFMYPPKVLKHKEIVDVMEECNTEKQVCDTEKMSECGRKKFEKASEKYEEKAKEQKLEDKTLPEMFANSQKEVASACNETLVCFEAKADMKMEELEKEMEKKKKKEEEEKKKKEEEEKKKSEKKE